MINLIVAMDEKRGIGKANNLMWNIPEELKRFKEVTTGHPIIMGRKTWESLPKQPLKDRLNIIVTRNDDYEFDHDDVAVVDSLETALDTTEPYPETFIIGGGQIFEQGLKYAERLYITIVKGDYEADVFFPEYEKDFKVVYSEYHKTPKAEYTFYELIRK